jgi:hypothetical protein
MCFLGLPGKNSSNDYSIKIVNSKTTYWNVGSGYKQSEFSVVIPRSGAFLENLMVFPYI